MWWQNILFDKKGKFNYIVEKVSNGTPTLIILVVQEKDKKYRTTTLYTDKHTLGHLPTKSSTNDEKQQNIDLSLPLVCHKDPDHISSDILSTKEVLGHL